ncbi:hypothetical protein BDL97_03G105100 [Sphagnum fallax]|nr:hypothetical protein BDL97_03G105100 [Sphagnum fallax]
MQTFKQRWASFSGGPAGSAQSQTAPSNSGQSQPTPGQQLDAISLPKKFATIAATATNVDGGPAKSEIVFGRIPSWILTRSHLKFLRRCPIHEAHPMSFVLQEVPSRYLERAMMVVQNLTSLETFQCFSNQPAPMSILVWQAV